MGGEDRRIDRIALLTDLLFRNGVHLINAFYTQDEINLILGGTAARLYKLPVPHSRMFPEGRPDIFGERAAESVPFIPREQIQFPDPEGLRMSTKQCKRSLLPFTPAGPPEDE